MGVGGVKREGEGGGERQGEGERLSGGKAREM